MNNSILKLDVSKLRKLEVKTLANRVIKIVENNSPETLKIKEIFDLLVVLKPQIDHLKLGYGPHPITSELNELRRQRFAFAQGVINLIKTIEKGKVSGTQDALKIVKPLVIRHFQGLQKYDEITVYEKIAIFFELVEADENLESALDILELTAYLDNLQSVNATIEELYTSRTKNISERPKSITPGIVASVKIALQDLFKQIEVALIKNQELDYTPLVDELNEEIATFRAILRARASYFKNKANEVVDDNEVVIDDESEEEIETTETETRMYPMNEEVELMENLDDIDKKRTVAASSGQARPPIVSTKA